MRTNLMTLALIAILGTQVGAGEKKYSSKECDGISTEINFLLSLTPEMWNQLKKNPNNDEAAI